MLWAPCCAIDSEPYVMIRQYVLVPDMQVAIKIRTVSFLLGAERRGARGCGPGVEFVAPGAEPVAGECALDEC